MSPHADISMAQNEHAPAVQAVSTSGFNPESLANSNLPAIENRSHLRPTSPSELHDVVCVGFGPASLAIAVALHDSIDGDPSLDIPLLQSRRPKVAFLEQQEAFAWHSGMLLPGARMQITFMKDMATMRNPRSEFTFLNYLFQKDRLIEFTNLNTFLPQRAEYEDYMRWCARWFDDVVSYGTEVVKVIPEKGARGAVDTFVVVSKNLRTGEITQRRTKHVVIAAGGKANIPAPFPQNHPRVVHSSRFCHMHKNILKEASAPYKVAVVGNGQSAAEIFDFLHANYPNAHTRLLIKGGALRPSDDSPFVNEIFNPNRVQSTFNRDPTLRAKTLTEDKGTNYGVVRLNLLEHIYETLYTQRLRIGNSEEAQKKWPHQILPYRYVVDATESPALPGGIRLIARDQSPLYFSNTPGATEQQEVLDFDAVFVATGYQRDMHETLLKDARHLMPAGVLEDAKWTVGRDYKVSFADKKVASDAGVWLQGCCEKTHGLSDTLLSVLANRSGEIVKSIFDSEQRWDGGEQVVNGASEMRN